MQARDQSDRLDAARPDAGGHGNIADSRVCGSSGSASSGLCERIVPLNQEHPPMLSMAELYDSKENADVSCFPALAPAGAGKEEKGRPAHGRPAEELVAGGKDSDLCRRDQVEGTAVGSEE